MHLKLFYQYNRLVFMGMLSGSISCFRHVGNIIATDISFNGDTAKTVCPNSSCKPQL